MAALTDFLENALLNHAFRNSIYTPPATVYVALFTVVPGENSAGTEVSGNAYARQSIAFAAPGAPGSGTAGQILNSADVTFPTATGSWGTVVAIGLLDASTVGNLMAYETGFSLAVAANDAPRFQAGNFAVTMD